MGYHTEGANGDGTGFFNDYPDVIQFQQAWIYSERVAKTDGCGWDWGFRFDYVYGTDGQDTQAFGSQAGDWDEPWDRGGFYGHAIPQLYADIAYNDLTVRVGHFFSIIGYEVVPAPQNFFYSRSYTRRLESYTHTGVLAEWSCSDRLTFYGGWTQGSDTGFSDNGGNTFLGGVTAQIVDTLSVKYATMIGDFGFADSFGSDANGYLHSIVIDWQLTDCLKYVFQTNYIDNTTLITSILGAPSTSYSFNQYLLYDFNDRWSFGGRFEWAGAGVNGEAAEMTLGANYRPHTNVVIRPEVRFEDYDPVFGRQDQTLLGIDAIFTF